MKQVTKLEGRQAKGCWRETGAETKYSAEEGKGGAKALKDKVKGLEKGGYK